MRCAYGEAHVPGDREAGRGGRELRGIDVRSVVCDAASALERAALLWDQYGPEALVEEFVDGREVNIGVVGNGASAECLPLAEIEFRVPAGMPAIVTYDAKWIDGSSDWGASSVRCPAELDAGLAAQLRDVALRAYRGLGVRDYGRVDVCDRERRHPRARGEPQPRSRTGRWLCQRRPRALLELR